MFIRRHGISYEDSFSHLRHIFGFRFFDSNTFFSTYSCFTRSVNSIDVVGHFWNLREA